MSVHCPGCSTQVQAENINLERMIAKCANCHTVFSFAEQFAESVPAAARKLDIARPQKLIIEHTGAEIVLRWRWRSPKFYLLTVFALFWNGFLIVWFSMALSMGAWEMAAFGSIHAAVGIGLLYYVLAGFVNTTEVRVGMGTLRIRHGPLPWPGNRQLDAALIAQVYCKENRHRSKNGVYYSYSVHAQTSTGTHEKLLSRLEDTETALYVEQEVERFLGITDMPVRGELPR